ncbi:MAG: hypothetical protein K2K06_01755 [Oscillospiraceae bacterium]|nr:hypothetical protein [Oscillospiraceae bacterium]
MENQRSFTNRLVCYFVGLFIMTIGIAISVKSNLGVSPVSSIPYTMTVCWGIEMGKATILFHAVLILIQVLILRKKFKLKLLLQLPVGIIFGYFTTFCNSLAENIPTTDNFLIRIGMILISVVLVAIGIFLYLPADIMPLAGEGVMQAVSDTLHIEFSKVKIAFDVTMVIISLVTCLLLLHNLGSVGLGTVIAAIMVGIVLGWIKKFWAKYKK